MLQREKKVYILLLQDNGIPPYWIHPPPENRRLFRIIFLVKMEEIR